MLFHILWIFFYLLMKFRGWVWTGRLKEWGGPMVGPGPDMTKFPSHPRAHEASRVYTAFKEDMQLFCMWWASRIISCWVQGGPFWLCQGRIQLAVLPQPFIRSSDCRLWAKQSFLDILPLKLFSAWSTSTKYQLIISVTMCFAFNHLCCIMGLYLPFAHYSALPKG